MGAANSYIFAGLGWAQVGSVHHRHYKFLPSEGGMHAPMIARFPGVLTPGDDRHAFASALDIVPTFLDVAGVEHPWTEYYGRDIHPMRGRSLLPYMRLWDASGVYSGATYRTATRSRSPSRSSDKGSSLWVPVEGRVD